MILRWSVRANTYHDSVKLMRLSEALGSEPGVGRAAAVMATPLNIQLLAVDGLLPGDAAASPDDLLIALLAEDEAAGDAALARVETLLAPRSVDSTETRLPPRSIEQAAVMDAANLAVVAVPGQYAAAEAYAALNAGMHVFLFSDNVSLQDEVRLKQRAETLDLLVMGPDCGTAIMGGVGLGFANRVGRGPVGIVGASGTGIQQLCCLLDEASVGIAHAIGTGGRDLSTDVGASMTRRALRLLDEDDSIEAIAVISKPPSVAAATRLHADLVRLSKPVVACLPGAGLPDQGNVHYAANLLDAAADVLDLIGIVAPQEWTASVLNSPTSATPNGRVYGLYAGGTLCSEAGQILDGLGVRHHLVDLGADEYTRGRAHPIIDPRLRESMLAELTDRADVVAVLLDVILGDLAHPDPAGALLPAVRAFRTGSSAPVLAALIGARDDPQNLPRQRAALEEAGVVVFSANATAARQAGELVRAS